MASTSTSPTLTKHPMSFDEFRAWCANNRESSSNFTDSRSSHSTDSLLEPDLLQELGYISLGDIPARFDPPAGCPPDSKTTVNLYDEENSENYMANRVVDPEDVRAMRMLVKWAKGVDAYQAALARQLESNMALAADEYVRLAKLEHELGLVQLRLKHALGNLDVMVEMDQEKEWWVGRRKPRKWWRFWSKGAARDL